MKIVIVGGTGLIGSRVASRLREEGHEAEPASPATGVDTVTGAGLDRVLAGADAVVDVSNSPSFEDSSALDFFETSTCNLLRAEAEAGVRHHVALSVVGADRMAGSGYMRAKVVQEKLIEQSSLPYSIVRATQFFEFIDRITDAATVGDNVRLAPVSFQPMAADDVARAVARVAVGSPIQGTVELGGPRRFRLDELAREVLAARGDPREVIADPSARYYGATLSEGTLVPGAAARLGAITLEEWRSRSRPARVTAGG